MAATDVMLAGQVIVGACVSLTVTVNEQLGPAVVVQVTVVVPFGKKEPEAGEQVIVPQLPEAVGAGYVTVAPHWFGSFDLVRFAGQVIAVQLFTVTVKVHCAVFICASVAVQVTVVVPTAKHVPEAGEQLAVAPGQLSVGVGVV